MYLQKNVNNNIVVYNVVFTKKTLTKKYKVPHWRT